MVSSTTGKTLIRNKEDPILRFQWGADLRKFVDNDLRYKTQRMEQEIYRKELGYVNIILHSFAYWSSTNKTLLVAYFHKIVDTYLSNNSIIVCPINSIVIVFCYYLRNALNLAFATTNNIEFIIYQSQLSKIATSRYLMTFCTK